MFVSRVVTLLILLSLAGGVALAAESRPLTPSSTPPGYLQSGRSEAQSAREIFGLEAGYIHPFLSISETWKDNFFNEPDHEAEEWVTTFSPGAWLAFPAMQVQPEMVSVLNTVAGGQSVSKFRYDTDRRIQSYAYYSADIPRHKNFEDAEETTHTGEGMLAVNLRGGLSLELSDVYLKTHDPFSRGAIVTRELDSYDSNLLKGLASYEVGEKLRLRGGFNYYTLSYDDRRNEFRDRDDLGSNISVLYQVAPKTELFYEFEYIDIDYDIDVNSDSEEYHNWLGMQWEATQKTRGRVKAGYSKKDHKAAGKDDRDDFILEAQANYLLTPKASINLLLTRKPNESDIAGTDDRLSHFFQAAWVEQLTAKVSASLNVNYTRDSYRGTVVGVDKTGKRTDDYYGGGLGASWMFKRWLSLAVGWNFEKRDSSFNEYDYDGNTVYVSLTGSM